MIQPLLLLNTLSIVWFGSVEGRRKDQFVPCNDVSSRVASRPITQGIDTIGHCVCI